MFSHLPGSFCSTSLWMSTLVLISAWASQIAAEVAPRAGRIATVVTKIKGYCFFSLGVILILLIEMLGNLKTCNYIQAMPFFFKLQKGC